MLGSRNTWYASWLRPERRAMDYQARGDDHAQSWPALDDSHDMAVCPPKAAVGVRQTLELHELCTMFPRMSGTEFDSLRDDIKVNGLREQIILLDDQVLDGGNRYRACLDAGVAPEFRQYNGNDPVQYVLSKNLLRRHLTAGQRSVIVALAANWDRAHTHGGARVAGQEATLPLEAVATRATRSESSERTQKDADKVAREAPALASKVASGEMTLPQAIKHVRPEVGKPKPNEVERLRTENESLKERIAELSDRTQEACGVAEDLSALSQGEELRRMSELRRERDAALQKRDDLQRENAQLTKQCKALQRRLDKQGEA